MSYFDLNWAWLNFPDKLVRVLQFNIESSPHIQYTSAWKTVQGLQSLFYFLSDGRRAWRERPGNKTLWKLLGFSFFLKKTKKTKKTERLGKRKRNLRPWLNRSAGIQSIYNNANTNANANANARSGATVSEGSYWFWKHSAFREAILWRHSLPGTGITSLPVCLRR